MTTDRDRILSEFIDSWNAGRRPDIDEHLARVPEGERAELEDDITSFIRWAPTPDYDDATVEAIRAEPAVAAAFASYDSDKPGLWPALLPRWRERASLSTADLARRLVAALGMASDREEKTQQYLERVEAGELEPSGFSQRLLDALAQVLEVPRQRLESAGESLRAIAAAPPPGAMPASPQFRASSGGAARVRSSLELMAGAMAKKSERDWDEIDELFRGGR